MKLAIIIPVYNAEETIKRAILSVDTSVPYEIICINDGSTDQTSMLDYVLMKMSFSVKSIPLLSKRSLKREIFNLYLTLYMAIMREKDQ